MDERSSFVRLGDDAFRRGLTGLAIMYNDVAIRMGVEMLDANVAKLSPASQAALKKYSAR